MGADTGFSSPLTEFAWAKWDRYCSDGDDWLSLHRHLADTAAVAEILFETWLSVSQRAFLAEAFGTEELASRVTVWLAAAHDVGKCSSAFAMKSPPRRSHMEGVGYVFPEPDPPIAEQRAYPHGIAGQLAVTAYLGRYAHSAATGRTARGLAEVVGGHHGVFPQRTDAPFDFGAGEHPCWADVRIDLLRRADRIAGLGDTEWRRILAVAITEPTQALLTGFLILCDWVASNQWLFPFGDRRTSAERARAASERLRLGEHWRPNAPGDIDRYFATRFGIERPRPVQRTVAELAAGLDEAAVILVEAPTGEGKTEAGFIAAEVLADRFGLHGVMLLLPTRATANAMFGRMLGWLRTGDPGDGSVAVSLAHAKAQFDDRFRELIDAQRGRPRHVYDEDGDWVVTNQWYLGRKRSALADLVVGTIDQLLFSTLKAKHAVLRHLGLTGKVVIIDEVHAADEFMRTYLLRALQWLGAYGVPVVALSATLPPAQRRELLHAYQQGARRRTQQRLIRADEMPAAAVVAAAEARSYPLVTALGSGAPVQIAPERSGRRAEYRLDEIADDELVDTVLREAAEGGCIAVVRNTVRRAQEVYAALRERYDGEIELFHSRFTVEARNLREQRLVDRLGPDGAHRPNAMIVVATQVVESSLDVDFDLMFTDIAPTDLLIQRIGRVHRHARPAEERPATMREPRIVLTGGTGVLRGGVPPEFDRGVRLVYGEALLLRSCAALREVCGATGADADEECAEPGSNRIRVPDDVPELIRVTYAGRVEAPPGWEQRLEAAERERAARIRDRVERSESFVIGAPGRGRIAHWSRLAQREASEEQLGGAQVRDAELAVEVVLVQRRSGTCYSLPWLPDPYGGQPVDFMAGLDDEDLARTVATCTVSLPSWMTRGAGLDAVLDDLERNGIEGWQRSVWLRGMLPLVLDEDLCATVNGLRVRYDEKIGLLIDGKEDS